MGLAIVKQYVEAHGGRVHVHSTKGEGSNFAIRLPIVEPV
jgi:signal transduction histidine kinase